MFGMFGIDFMERVKDTMDEFIENEERKTRLMKEALDDPSLLQDEEHREAIKEIYEDLLGSLKEMVPEIKKTESVDNKPEIQEQKPTKNERKLDMNPTKKDYEEIARDTESRCLNFDETSENKWGIGFLKTGIEEFVTNCIFGNYETLLLGTHEELKTKLLKCQMDLVFQERYEGPNPGQNIKIIKAIKTSSLTEKDVGDLFNYQKGLPLCQYERRSLYRFFNFGEIANADYDRSKINFAPGETSLIDKICGGPYDGNFVVLRCVPCRVNEKDGIAWIGIIKLEEELTQIEKSVVIQTRKLIQDEYEFHQKALELSKKVKKVCTLVIDHTKKDVFTIGDDDEKKYYLEIYSSDRHSGKKISTMANRAVAIAADGNSEDIFDYKMLKW